jgi:hypothetical protein
LVAAANAIADWQRTFGPHDAHPSVRVTDERLGAALAELTSRLADNYPFFDPAYAGPDDEALEALYVARELHPDRGVAYSSEAHYTHARMCAVLGMDGTPVGVDGAGGWSSMSSMRCSPLAGSAPSSRPPAPPVWAPSIPWIACSKSRAGMAFGSTSMRPTAAS